MGVSVWVCDIWMCWSVREPNFWRVLVHFLICLFISFVCVCVCVCVCVFWCGGVCVCVCWVSLSFFTVRFFPSINIGYWQTRFIWWLSCIIHTSHFWVTKVRLLYCILMTFYAFEFSNMNYLLGFLTLGIALPFLQNAVYFLYPSVLVGLVYIVSILFNLNICHFVMQAYFGH